MKKFILYLLLLFIIIILSCSKKKSVTTEYIPSELKEYLLFKYGSLWIYKNENTGTFDTSTVLKDPVFTYNHHGGYDYDPIWEECITVFTGSFLKEADLDPTWGILDFSGYGCQVLHAGSNSIGQIFYTESSSLKYLNLLDSLTINNHLFHDVLVTRWNILPQHNDTIQSTSYFVKHIGLIKYIHKVNNIDNTWTLIDYHVIQ